MTGHQGRTVIFIVGSLLQPWRRQNARVRVDTVAYWPIGVRGILRRHGNRGAGRSVPTKKTKVPTKKTTNVRCDGRVVPADRMVRRAAPSTADQSYRVDYSFRRKKCPSDENRLIGVVYLWHFCMSQQNDDDYDAFFHKWHTSGEKMSKKVSSSSYMTLICMSQ